MTKAWGRWPRLWPSEGSARAFTRATFYAPDMVLLGLSAAALQGCALPERDEAKRLKPICFTMLKTRTCVPGPSPKSSDAVKVRNLALRPDAGRVVIVRARDGDIQGLVLLGLNGQPLESLIPYSAVAVDVPPGLHEMRIQEGVGAPLPLELRAGDVAVLEVRRRGRYGQKFDLVRLSRQEGRALIDESRILRVLDRTVSPPSTTGGEGSVP
ncbi:hypothetical protein EV672_11331 [Aquabacterium commune]|jgi:hypothetical protein|uniref:DUF2846 domain-containing protein n=1 Tax=Aquabacterium commune TaxID=70586 RepID=A0A4V3CUP3_9BURK|nr:hypothetical protein [Aquabacterium commune]TDP79458.1 hypothetical protein EV672_11331 [Aquabacterium commune]